MTDDIKLPPRPEPDGFITDGPFNKPVVINVYRDSTLEAYAREAVRLNAAQAESADQAQALREALEDIRSRSSIVSSSSIALTARLGDIYQIADAALAREGGQ